MKTPTKPKDKRFTQTAYFPVKCDISLIPAWVDKNFSGWKGICHENSGTLTSTDPGIKFTFDAKDQVLQIDQKG